MGTELSTTSQRILTDITIDEDKKQGNRTAYTFVGTREQCELERLNQRARGARSISLRPKGDGNWELIATYNYDAETGGGSDVDAPVDTHELDVQMAQQDVFLNPKMSRSFADGGLSESVRQKLNAAVQSYKSVTWKTAEEAIAAVTRTITGTESARALSYFKLIALTGVDHFIFYRSVYSRIITGATPGQIHASFVGINKLWNSGQILSWESVPNDWYFNLNDIASIWHKSQPRVQTNIGKTSKTQISYQYIGSDEASTLLYDNYA